MTGEILEKLVLFNERSVFFVIFGDHGRNCTSKSFSVDKPEVWGFNCFDGSWARSWIKKCKLPKSLSWLYTSLWSSIDFHSEFTFVKNKEWAGSAILLHKILSLIDFAQLEFFEKNFFDFFILNKRGEGEVSFQAFENAELIVGTFCLRYFSEIFVNIVVINCFECSHLSGFTFALQYESRYLFEHGLTSIAFEFEVDEWAD